MFPKSIRYFSSVISKITFRAVSKSRLNRTLLFYPHKFPTIFCVQTIHHKFNHFEFNLLISLVELLIASELIDSNKAIHFFNQDFFLFVEGINSFTFDLPAFHRAIDLIFKIKLGNKSVVKEMYASTLGSGIWYP